MPSVLPFLQYCKYRCWIQFEWMKCYEHWLLLLCIDIKVLDYFVMHLLSFSRELCWFVNLSDSLFNIWHLCWFPVFSSYKSTSTPEDNDTYIKEQSATDYYSLLSLFLVVISMKCAVIFCSSSILKNVFVKQLVDWTTNMVMF